MYGIHTINHILPRILFTCSLFQILKFMSFLLVVAFSFILKRNTHTRSNTRTCKVTLRHKMPQSRESCPGKSLTARGFALPARPPRSLPRVSVVAGLPRVSRIPCQCSGVFAARPCTPTPPGPTLRSSQVAATFHRAEPIPTDSSLA